MNNDLYLPLWIMNVFCFCVRTVTIRLTVTRCCQQLMKLPSDSADASSSSTSHSTSYVDTCSRRSSAATAELQNPSLLHVFPDLEHSGVTVCLFLEGCEWSQLFSSLTSMPTKDWCLNYLITTTSAFFVKQYFPVRIFWFLIGGLSTVHHYVSS